MTLRLYTPTLESKRMAVHLIQEKIYIQNALAGDTDAFGTLVKHYQDHVYRTAYARVGNREDALDLTQEIFLAAYESLHTLRDFAKFKAWLTGIVLNRCRSWRRSQTRQVETVPIADKDSGVLEGVSTDALRQQQLCQELWEEVNALSNVNREVITMHYYSGYSYHEIAEALGVPASTVRSRLQEARQQLRKEFASMMGAFRLEELVAPEGLVEKVMERVARLPAPVPRAWIGRVVPIVAIGTLLAATAITFSFIRFAAFQPGAPAQLAEAKIAFMSNRDGNEEIYLMNADGTNPVRLTQSPGSDWGPDWSPDGTKIAFHSLRDGNYEIYVMNADGTNLVNLTKHPALEAASAWFPTQKLAVSPAGNMLQTLWARIKWGR